MKFGESIVFFIKKYLLSIILTFGGKGPDAITQTIDYERVKVDQQFQPMTSW